MNLDAKVNNALYRKDQTNIIAMNRQLAKLGPVRLAYDSLGYVAGQAVARDTTSGFWEKFSAVSGDTPDSHCILFEDVVSDEFKGSTGTAVARGIFGGDVYQDKCTELDSTFKSALGGRLVVNNGENIFSF